MAHDSSPTRSSGSISISQKKARMIRQVQNIKITNWKNQIGEGSNSLIKSQVFKFQRMVNFSQFSKSKLKFFMRFFLTDMKEARLFFYRAIIRAKHIHTIGIFHGNLSANTLFMATKR